MQNNYIIVNISEEITKMAHATPDPLLKRIIASSVSLSKRASKIIQDVFKFGKLEILDKGNNDFQTRADRYSQMCIVSTLRKAYPGLIVKG